VMSFLKNSFTINAPAKVNLFLKVLGKRRNGFHNIETVFQTISLYDKIYIYPSKDFIVSCPSINQEDNLVYKGGILLMDYVKKKKGARIVLQKNIPIASGLGGGSSDTASCLLGLNEFWDLGLSKKELKALGRMLGADVPYFIDGGTRLGEGIGTKLKKLPSIPKCYFVLVVFDFMLVTKEVYEKFKIKNSKLKIENIILAIKNGDLYGIAKNLHNDLESVVIKNHPEIEEVKNILIKEGALNALMSGSGPTVFGIVDDKRKVERIMDKLISSNIKALVTEPV